MIQDSPGREPEANAPQSRDRQGAETPPKGPPHAYRRVHGTCAHMPATIPQGAWHLCVYACHKVHGTSTRKVLLRLALREWFASGSCTVAARFLPGGTSRWPSAMCPRALKFSRILPKVAFRSVETDTQLLPPQSDPGLPRTLCENPRNDRHPQRHSS